MNIAETIDKMCKTHRRLPAVKPVDAWDYARVGFLRREPAGSWVVRQRFFDRAGERTFVSDTLHSIKRSQAEVGTAPEFCCSADKASMPSKHRALTTAPLPNVAY